MRSFQINRILQVILAAFSIIVLRVWHLGIIQREEKLIEAKKPQTRSILLRADRGTICDRFHIPLALNRICYNATIYYNQISQMPIAEWREDEDGVRRKHFVRKEYIRDLSIALAEVLSLEAERVEDLIHSKASLFPHAPFLLKAGISEREHYALRQMERDWPSLHAEASSERFYPLGKVGSHLIGTLGSISQREYRSIAEEMGSLQEAVNAFEQGTEFTLPRDYASFDAVYARLYELKEKAYKLNDLIGKSGIEKQFEEDLRGFWGLTSFEVDQKGRFVRELPGKRAPAPGKQLVLSISSELQQFAEELLMGSEKDREGRSLGIDPVDKRRKVQKQPWIKGGAIVGLDPETGEVLALASFPRYDPNDFIPTANAETSRKKQAQVCRWLENERYVGALWDGTEVMTRERLSRKVTEESIPLSWEFYLDLILALDSPIRTIFSSRIDDVLSATRLQEDFEALRYFSKIEDGRALLDALSSKQTFGPDGADSAKRLEALLSSIPSTGDKLLCIDLCRLAVDSTRFSDALLGKVGSMKLSTYRSLCQSFQRSSLQAKAVEMKKFHQTEFKAWRAEHQGPFLKQKRKEEKERKTFARPYLDYLDQKERELFQEHWNRIRLSGLDYEPPLRDELKKLEPELAEEFLKTMRSFRELDRPLKGFHAKYKTEKDLAAAAIQPGGFGFSRSYAFQTSAPQGSIFKLVPAYEGLRQGASLSILDTPSADAVAFSLSGSPYPRIYKGGRLPKSSLNQIGKIDVVGALEQSSNPFFSIIAGDFLKSPNDLYESARLLGYGAKTGIELPGETRAKLPDDLATNRTGLYSFAIGQHTLLASPIQTAVMLGAIANSGKVLKPKITLRSVGFSSQDLPLSAFSPENAFAKRELASIGIQFPLFTGASVKQPLSISEEPPTEIVRTVPMPKPIRSQLLEGMDRVLWGEKGRARVQKIRGLQSNPALLADYLTLHHQMVGKTSTAEVLFNPNINPSSPAQMYNHTWCGAISFDADAPLRLRFDHPELVVVVLLRFSDAGKEVAPLAAQMVRKWRDIKRSHM
jgi:cell division protein FtsI/penicillin-binding protein 2